MVTLKKETHLGYTLWPNNPVVLDCPGLRGEHFRFSLNLAWDPLSTTNILPYDDLMSQTYLD